jgi:hypothetical protein
LSGDIHRLKAEKDTSMKKIFFTVCAASLLAGTSVASAQAFRDDPPGYAWQRRGIVDAQGINPLAYQYRRYGYRGYDDYAYAPGVRAYRSWRWDSPPGARFQNRGIDEDLGRNPLLRNR